VKASNLELVTRLNYILTTFEHPDNEVMYVLTVVECIMRCVAHRYRWL